MGVWCNQIAIIGDSLTQQGNGALHSTFPTAIINARGGRTTEQGWEAAEGISESNVANCWVFALGTNDVFNGIDPAVSLAAISNLCAVIGSSGHCWWIEPHFIAGGSLSGALDTAWFCNLIPPWIPKVNLHTPPADYTADGIHLTPAGYANRAAAIAKAIAA